MRELTDAEEREQAPYLPKWFVRELSQYADTREVSPLRILVEGVRLWVKTHPPRRRETIQLPGFGRISLGVAKELMRALGREFGRRK